MIRFVVLTNITDDYVYRFIGYQCILLLTCWTHLAEICVVLTELFVIRLKTD